MNTSGFSEQHDSTTEERILNAAIREFGEKGFFGARTQAIAEEAGVNKALLHYYFRSKEKLYHQVIRNAMQQVLSNVGRACVEQGGVIERLGRVVDAYLDTVGKQPGIMKIILREVVDGGPGIRKSFRENGAEGAIILGRQPAELLAFLGRHMNLEFDALLHLFVSIVGMCVISFISPPIIEAVANIPTPDFSSFLEHRRKAIKAMVVAYAREHIIVSNEKVS